MGRSKFPGKPSKHILRKRINVLPPVAEISNVESSGSVTVETAVENNHVNIRYLTLCFVLNKKIGSNI